MEQKIKNLSDTKTFNVDRELAQKIFCARGKIGMRNPPKKPFCKVPKMTSLPVPAFIKIPKLEIFSKGLYLGNFFRLGFNLLEIIFFVCQSARAKMPYRNFSYC